MILFPQTKEIYMYNNKEYIVHSQIPFYDVFAQEVLNKDTQEGSHFFDFNWWSFIFNAKHLRTNEKHDAY